MPRLERRGIFDGIRIIIKIVFISNINGVSSNN